MHSRAPTWLRRGLNIAGVFDRRDSTPTRWPDRDLDLRMIAAAGFSHVRLPVRWWGHANLSSPYEIEEKFAEDVDQALTAATRVGLGVVLSMHHADAVMSDDALALDRLCNLWRQTALRFRSSQADLAYDLLNEPRAAMSRKRWNAVLPTVLASVREVDPDRLVIVGGAQMGTLAGLAAVTVPADEHLILTFHYYEPFRFTHQGAYWEPGGSAWLGTTWGTTEEQAQVASDIEAAASYAAEHGLALYLGEFGTIETADPASRVALTRAVRGRAERFGMAWAGWDFRTDFAVSDAETRCWHPELLEALTE